VTRLKQLEISFLL